MTDYIKSFNTISEYQAYEQSESFQKPNASYIWTENHARSTVATPPGPFNGYEYVDFGLPSGLLWAKRNVGANSETDYGDYFQWGDVVNKTATGYDNPLCNWENYKYGNGSSDATGMTKYNASDGLTILEASDDAAHVNMGGNWRMPTSSEGVELLQNTTRSWTVVNGVQGMLLTGKNNYSGTTLFFSAAGYRNVDALQFSGNSAYYWTSSLYSIKSYANYLQAGSSYAYYNQYIQRFYGCPVRAVIQPS